MKITNSRVAASLSAVAIAAMACAALPAQAYFDGRSAPDNGDPIRTDIERFADSRVESRVGEVQRLTGGQEVSVEVPRAKAGDVVAINPTAVNPVADGWLAVYTGTYDNTSTLNYEAGRNVAGVTYVTLGEDKSVKVLSLVDTDFLLDRMSIMGSDAVTGVSSFRAHDTRDDATVAPHFTAEAPLVVQVAGRGGVPQNARAAVVNLTATGGVADGWVETNPTSGAQGATSALNYRAGQTVANNAIVPLDGQGRLMLGSLNAVHLVVDVTGYVADGSPLTLISGKRVLDSREGVPSWVKQETVSAPGKAFDGGVNRQVRFSGADIAAQVGLPVDAVSAVAVNVTVVDPAGPGFAEIHRGAVRRPMADGSIEEVWRAGDSSVANFVAGQNVANGALIATTELATLDVLTQVDAELVVDIVGYVPTAGRTITKEWAANNWGPDERSAVPFRMGPGSTITFNAPDDRRFRVPTVSTPDLHAECAERVGEQWGLQSPDADSDGPLVRIGPELKLQNVGDNGFAESFTMTVGEELSGSITCGGQVLEGNFAESYDYNWVLDLDIDADAAVVDVTWDEIAKRVENGTRHQGLGSFGPGDTLKITGAPAGTFFGDVELALEYSLPWVMPYMPTLDWFPQTWTAVDPLAGDQASAAANEDGTELTITLPSDPTVYTEASKSGAWPWMLFVRAKDGNTGEYWTTHFNGEVGRP